MEVKSVDFDSLVLPQQDQTDFAKANSFTGQKSFVKQLTDNTYFITLREKHHGIKVLLNTEQFLVHRDQKILDKITHWQERKLVGTPLDVLAQIGFDTIERSEKQLEMFETGMEKLEEKILENPQKSQQAQILQLHRQAIYQKKQLNEYLAVFVRCKQNNPIWDELILRTQSSLDNARQIIELMENLREAYQASVDNRLNDIMKLLTVLATILLPINLLTSFFGMNFENMPLIHHSVGIYVFYSLSCLLIICSIVYIKRKQWI